MMTPKQRAEEAIFGDASVGIHDEGYSYRVTVKQVEDAIRQAENDALERAAQIAGGHSKMYVAEAIRSLKHKEP